MSAPKVSWMHHLKVLERTNPECITQSKILEYTILKVHESITKGSWMHHQKDLERTILKDFWCITKRILNAPSQRLLNPSPMILECTVPMVDLERTIPKVLECTNPRFARSTHDSRILWMIMIHDLNEPTWHTRDHLGCVHSINSLVLYHPMLGSCLNTASVIHWPHCLGWSVWNHAISFLL